ncbi:hypothetical protein [Thalassoglobus polymorphus]|nr:hypothetical protein [Thalassoglobus polymorphus]
MIITRYARASTNKFNISGVREDQFRDLIACSPRTQKARKML